MNNYPVSPEENYAAICEEMNQLAVELEQNPHISEERFRKILQRYGDLGNLLNQYGRMMWKI
jgi:hypothetical protein